MRKISKEIAKAFIEGKEINQRGKNTATYGGSIFLHGNEIAWWETPKGFNRQSDASIILLSDENMHLCFSMCGWGTPTTRERLNTLFALLFEDDDVCLFQKNHKQFLSINGVDYEIDDSERLTLRKVKNHPVFLDEEIREDLIFD
tara:strand:+ start:52 stop:486 length:435 start_codon:yes stop_codon:yes gene_type:complete